MWVVGTVLALVCAGSLFTILKINLSRKTYALPNVVIATAFVYFLWLVVMAVSFGVFQLLRGVSFQELQTIETLHEFVWVYKDSAAYVIAGYALITVLSNLVIRLKHGSFRNPRMENRALLLFVLITALVRVASWLIHKSGQAPTGFGAVLDFLVHDILQPLYCVLMGYVSCIRASVVLLNRMVPKKVPESGNDFVMILGCAIDKGSPLRPIMKRRVDTALAFGKKQEEMTGESMRYIVSGGKGTEETISESSAMELRLKSRGVKDEQILTEKESITTFQNFRNSKAIADELIPDAKIAIATSDYHAFRSGLFATRAGFRNVNVVTAKTEWYYLAGAYGREAIAILFYFQ